MMCDLVRNATDSCCRHHNACLFQDDGPQKLSRLTRSGLGQDKSLLFLPGIRLNLLQLIGRLDRAQAQAAERSMSGLIRAEHHVRLLWGRSMFLLVVEHNMDSATMKVSRFSLRVDAFCTMQRHRTGCSTVAVGQLQWE